MFTWFSSTWNLNWLVVSSMLKSFGIIKTGNYTVFSRLNHQCLYHSKSSSQVFLDFLSFPAQPQAPKVYPKPNPKPKRAAPGPPPGLPRRRHIRGRLQPEQQRRHGLVGEALRGCQEVHVQRLGAAEETSKAKKRRSWKMWSYIIHSYIYIR